MGRSAYKAKATKLANTSRRAQRAHDNHKKAPRSDVHTEAIIADAPLSMSSDDSDELDDAVQFAAQLSARRHAVPPALSDSEESSEASTVGDSSIGDSMQDSDGAQSGSEIDFGHAPRPQAPRGKSPTNQILLTKFERAAETMQQMRAGVDADIDRAALLEEQQGQQQHPDDEEMKLLFGSFGSDSSGSSSRRLA